MRSRSCAAGSSAGVCCCLGVLDGSTLLRESASDFAVRIFPGDIFSPEVGTAAETQTLHVYFEWPPVKK